MRDLTQREIDILYDKGVCPFCLKEEFYEGPSGGMNTNWFCANPDCAAGFNLTQIKGFGCQLIREPRQQAFPDGVVENFSPAPRSVSEELSTSSHDLSTYPSEISKVRWFWRPPRVRGILRSMVDVLKSTSSRTYNVFRKRSS